MRMSSGLVNRPLCASRERFLWMLYAAEHLAAQIHEAPVWIIPCLEGATPTRTAGFSIYPAVQNMFLAARALGLGATLTTLYLAKRAAIDHSPTICCITRETLKKGPGMC